MRISFLLGQRVENGRCASLRSPFPMTVTFFSCFLCRSQGPGEAREHCRLLVSRPHLAQPNMCARGDGRAGSRGIWRSSENKRVNGDVERAFARRNGTDASPGRSWPERLVGTFWPACQKGQYETAMRPEEEDARDGAFGAKRPVKSAKTTRVVSLDWPKPLCIHSGMFARACNVRPGPTRTLYCVYACTHKCIHVCGRARLSTHRRRTYRADLAPFIFGGPRPPRSTAAIIGRNFGAVSTRRGTLEHVAVRHTNAALRRWYGVIYARTRFTDVAAPVSCHK